MPTAFVEMAAFQPDGGFHGAELELVQNYLPVHRAWNSLNKKLVVASVADGPMTGAYVHIYQQTVQVQIARPDADTLTGSWERSPSTGNLFETVNESNPSDAQFIYVGGAPAAAAMTLRLTDLTDPLSAADHILRWRYRIPETPTSNWTLTAELLEGSTVRATDSVTGAAATAFVQRAYTLTAAEANAITDYTNLLVRFTATVPGTVQHSRPESDVSVGSWTTQAGSSSNLWDTVNEAVASDADYIQSPVLTPGGPAYTYKTALSDVVDPLTDEGHRLLVRVRGSNFGVLLTFRLKQGETVILEGEIQTLFASFAQLSTNWTDFEELLTAAIVGAVSDYTDLTLELEARLHADAALTADQFVGPDGTDSNPGAWAPSGAATLQEAVDETVASDADFIVSPATDAEAACSLTLAPATDPLTHADHILQVRTAGATGVSLRVDLLEGGGVIFTDTVALGAHTTHTFTLTAGEASLIGDYGDLSVRLTRLVSGVAGSAEVSWVRFQTPEPARAQISFIELEVPSKSRAEVSWTELQVPDLAQAYKGDVPTNVCGSKTKLYTFTTSGFTDISKVGGYGLADKPGAWRFCSMGNDIIAVNRADLPQYRANNTGLFADLITSTLKPKARFCCVSRGHLFLGDINLTGHYPDEFWWSYFDNARDFDNAPAGQGGFARIVSRPGQLMGLAGGDFVTAFKRNSMHLIGWQGGALPWRVDDISSATGTPYPSSIVQTPYGVFFCDGMTFRQYLGGTGEQSVIDIGTGVLAQFLQESGIPGWSLARSEPADIAAEDQLMFGWWDTSARVVCWLFQNAPYERFEPDPPIEGLPQEVVSVIPPPNRHTRGVVYNPAEQRWGVLRDDSLDAAMVIGRPSVIDSADHLLRGTIGFDWNGTTTSWFRFDSETTYEGEFRSKRRALGIDEVEGERMPRAARLLGVMPVFSHIPRESAVPGLTVQVTASNDPFFVEDAREKTVTLTQANGQGIFPVDATGLWFSFKVTIPELTTQSARAFRGLYCFYDYAGSPAGV